MSAKYQNKIGLINMSGTGPKKYVCVTTKIKLVCFRCGVCFFFVLVWFVLFCSWRGWVVVVVDMWCVDVLVGWGGGVC